MSKEKEIDFDELAKNADPDSIIGLMRSIKEMADNIKDLSIYKTK